MLPSAHHGTKRPVSPHEADGEDKISRRLDVPSKLPHKGNRTTRSAVEPFMF